MSKPAEIILSAYSFIYASSLEKLLSVGHNLKNGRPIPSFDENILVDLCSEAQQIFAKEKNIVEIEGNFAVVGNIQGNLHDLMRILQYSQNNQLKILFLGDYIDFGKFSLECLTLLFAKKITNPGSIYLIRGDNEFNSICTENGFRDEIVSNIQQSTNELNINNKDQEKEKPPNEFSKTSIYYKYTEKLYNSIMKVFSYLPIAAIINSTTFCMHGGLSPKLHHADCLLKIVQRPIYYYEDNLSLADILCSDPSNNSRGFFTKKLKGHGYLFNQESLSIFLRDNSFTRLIRSHQIVASGSYKSFNDQCITVHSASSYDQTGIKNSAIAELFQRNDGFRISTFFPIRPLARGKALFYKVQSAYKKPENNKIPLSISLLKPLASFSNASFKCVSGRESSRLSSQRSKFCASSRLRFNNPLKEKFMNNQRNASRFPKRPLIHDSFSAGFYEED